MVIVIAISYFVFEQSNQPALQQGVPIGDTANVGIQIDINRTELLPYIIIIGLVIYILWKHKYGNRQGYKDEGEAIKDAEERFKKLDIFPITVEQFQFQNQENKIEAVGTFRCWHEKFRNYGKPIWFEIRKNGNLKFDMAKIYQEPLPLRPKRVVIAKDKSKKDEEKK